MTLLDTQLAVFMTSDNWLARHPADGKAATSQGFYAEHWLLGHSAKIKTPNQTKIIKPPKNQPNKQKAPTTEKPNKQKKPPPSISVVHWIHTSNSSVWNHRMDSLTGKFRQNGQKHYTQDFHGFTLSSAARSTCEADKGSQWYRQQGFRHDGNRKNLLGTHISHAQSQPDWHANKSFGTYKHFYTTARNFLIHGKPKYLASPDTLKGCPRYVEGRQTKTG